MNRLRDLWRRFLRAIPGTRMHRAAAKRRLEDELRAAGLPRDRALRIVARRFPKGGA